MLRTYYISPIYGNSTAWTLEIGTNVPSFKFTRQTRQVPSFRLSLQLGTHMYWLHSPNPQVPSCTILFLARNTASMLCSEHCFFACFYARNTASLPASVLGTLLPPMLCSEPASLPASMPCSEHCFFACFCIETGIEVLFRAMHRSSVPSKDTGF